MLRELYPQTRYLLLDANLLVVLVIGQVRQQLFGRSPVEMYSNADYDLLVSLIGEFEGVVTTPYLLSEVNTLLTKTGTYYCRECRSALSALIPELSCTYTEPAILSRNVHFATFGISDISIVDSSATSIFVLTAEGPLTGLLGGQDIPVFKYGDLKSTFGLS